MSKASSGIAEVMPVYQVKDVEDMLKIMKNSNKWQIIAADSNINVKNNLNSSDTFDSTIIPSIPIHKFSIKRNCNVLLILGKKWVKIKWDFFSKL